MTHSILARASRSQIRDDPFPHLVLDEALPRDYYAELEASYPDLDFVSGGAPLASNALYLRSAVDVLESPRVPALWREFFAFHCSEAFFRQACELWRERIERLHPDLEDNFGRPLGDFTLGVRQPGKHDNPENRKTDVVMDCQFGTNSPVRSASSVRGPHVDNPAKLFAALLYFRHAADDSTGGDLELYRLKRRYAKGRATRIDPDSLEVFLRVPYAPNRMVMWLNSARSAHGVTPRSVTPRTRRYVNFLAECYAGRRGDYFTAFPARERSVRGLLERLRA